MTVLSRLPLLLRHLATLPRPADVLRSLELGLFAPRGMRAGMLWRLVGGELVNIASRGHTAAEEARYATFPVGIDAPLGISVRENRIDVATGVELARLHITELDTQLWSELRRRYQMASAVTIPLRFGGEAIGALAIVVDRPWPDDDDTTVLAYTVADALGLWATHPGSGVTHQRPPVVSRSWSLSFTDRQRDVLRLVAEGRDTVEIAALMGVSKSAVKQDLHWAMQAMRAPNRKAAATRARDLGLI